MEFGESTPPEALGNYTGFLLNWVAVRARRLFDVALEEVGLHRHQFALMSVVSADPGRTQQQLVEATHIDPSTMVQTLDSLADEGWAERRRHPTDRRKHIVHLTPAGKKKLKQARETAGRAGSQTFGRLDVDERAQLHAMLRKLAGFDA